MIFIRAIDRAIENLQNEYKINFYKSCEIDRLN